MIALKLPSYFGVPTETFEIYLNHSNKKKTHAILGVSRVNVPGNAFTCIIPMTENGFDPNICRKRCIFSVNNVKLMEKNGK